MSACQDTNSPRQASWNRKDSTKSMQPSNLQICCPDRSLLIRISSGFVHGHMHARGHARLHSLSHTRIPARVAPRRRQPASAATALERRIRRLQFLRCEAEAHLDRATASSTCPTLCPAPDKMDASLHTKSFSTGAMSSQMQATEVKRLFLVRASPVTDSLALPSHEHVCEAKMRFRRFPHPLDSGLALQPRVLGQELVLDMLIVL